MRKLASLASLPLGTASLGIVWALTWILSSASAQVAPEPLSFEVAVIRPAEGPNDPTFTSGTKISGSSVVMRNITVNSLIRAAFGVDARFLSGADWLKGSQTFDIRATIPAGVSARRVPEMIRRLLEERFKLTFHFERRERHVNALLVAKDGPKFQKSQNIDESMPGGAYAGVSAVSRDGAARNWISPSNSAMRITLLPDGGAEWSLIGMSLRELAYTFDVVDGLDVVDMTGLKGLYDFTFTAAAENASDLSTQTSTPKSDWPSPRQALQRLGLRLEKRKAMVDFLVIEHLEKMPTGN